MTSPKKTTIDRLAKKKAKYEAHLKRESANPAKGSAIVGRIKKAKAAPAPKAD